MSSSSAIGDIVVIGLLALLLIFFLFLLIRTSIKWQQAIQDRIERAKQKRRITNDEFRRTNGYSWDYVIVFKVYQEAEALTDFQRRFSAKYILENLTAAGLGVRSFYSLKRDHVFVKIRANIERLKVEANRVNFKLLLDKEKLAELCITGKQGVWTPLTIPFPLVDKGLENIRQGVEYTKESDLHPYDYVYAEYDDKDELQKLYKRHSSKVTDDSNLDDRSIFRGVDRLKLIHSIIVANHKNCGRLDMYRLVRESCVIAYFPLHDYLELAKLELKVLVFVQLPWKQDVNSIKDYFGEKIGLYFLWVGHYTSWLSVGGAIGFLYWLNVASDNNKADAQAMPYFATFICVWATLFLEYWKRKEKLYSMRWGTKGFEESEQVRPQFKGQKSISPIDGSPMLYFPSYERNRRTAMTSSVTFGLIIVVVAAIASIFALKLFMSGFKEFELGGVQLANIVASVLNALQIMGFNSLYGDLAFWLNDYENHRTETQYEDALIAKTFVFQFVNSFASMFYIAFVKPFIKVDACVGTCMQELQTAVGSIFLTQLAIGNITEVGVPAFQAWLSRRALVSEVSKFVEVKQPCDLNDSHTLLVSQETEMSEVERSFLMPEYHVMTGTFNDYAELVIQFGFTTMFVAAFPLAACMSFVNNYVEMRVDGWKLCEVMRRPEPRTCEDIGTWCSILEIISAICVLTNSAIVVYTGTNVQLYSWMERAWIFAVMSSAIFSAKWIIAVLVPDVTADVDIQFRRQALIIDTVVKEMDHNSDDDDAMQNDEKCTSDVPSYILQDFDDDAL